MLQAIGRSKRVTFDGLTIRIHQPTGYVTKLAVSDVGAVEFRSATDAAAGYLRFVRRRPASVAARRSTPEHDQLCVWFSEWREGGFVRLRAAIESTLRSEAADAS